jgi:hypothetical protein
MWRRANGWRGGISWYWGAACWNAVCCGGRAASGWRKSSTSTASTACTPFSAAKRRFSQFDFAEQTKGVECRKDGGVLDEIPAAYKDIDTVMENQSDLVDIVHTLKQVLCVKG